MTKEEATKKYYDLIELCKIEDLNCEKYNMHHVEPIFTLKEKYNVKRTKEIRYNKNIDFGEEIKCSIPHHVTLHFYLCFMFDKGTTLYKSAKSSFWFITNKSLTQSIESLTEEDVLKIGKYCEELKKTNWTDEDKKNYRKTHDRFEKDKEYRIKNKDKLAKQHSEYYREHKDERKEYYYDWADKNADKLDIYRKEYRLKIHKRLCLDPRYKISNHYTHKITNWKNLKEWGRKYKNNNLMKSFKDNIEFANFYLIYDDSNNWVYDINLANEILLKTSNDKLLEIIKLQNKNEIEFNDKLKKSKTVPSKINKRLCKDFRYYNNISYKNNKPTKFWKPYATYLSLIEWCYENLDVVNLHKHEVINFVKSYMLVNSNNEFVYDKDEALLILNEDSTLYKKNEKFNEKSIDRLCFDPRFKSVENKILKYKKLYGWCRLNKNKLNGFTPLEFANLCLIKNKNNFVYDLDEAIKILNTFGEKEYPHLTESKRIRRPMTEEEKLTRKQKMNKHPIIVCLESKEIHTARDWRELKFYTVVNVAKGKAHSCNKKHFKFLSDLNGNFIYDENKAVEIINDLPNEFFKIPIKKIDDTKIFSYKHLTDDEIKIRRQKLNKKPILFCSDTNEVHMVSEWYALGYVNCFKVAQGKRKSDKGLHFEFAKDEEGNYIYDEETALKIINSNIIGTINS